MNVEALITDCIGLFSWNRYVRLPRDFVLSGVVNNEHEEHALIADIRSIVDTR